MAQTTEAKTKCITISRSKRYQPATCQAKAKQHPETELLLFENYSLLSSKLSSKNSRRHSKK